MTSILLLEDSPGEAELFCHAFVHAWELLDSESKSPQPDIVVLRTAQDALEVLKEQVAQRIDLPDLVVLDLDLPGRTSLTFLRELRKNPRLANLPVIAMAWTDDQAIVQTLDKHGVVDCVVKPMRFAELVTVVGRFCRLILSETPHQHLLPGEGDPSA